MKKDTAFTQTVRDLLAEINQAGAWIKPWNVRLPRNLAGRLYSGSNVATLFNAMRQNQWQSPFFGTFKQALDFEAPVKKGSKAQAKVIFTKTYTKKDKKTEEEKSIFTIKEYAVFNVSQMEEGDKIKDDFQALESDQITDLVAPLYEALNVSYSFNAGQSAHYQPSAHVIELPKLELFKSSSDYLSTAIHELVHWTGKDLVQRDLSGTFGSQSYAKEELIAEFSTMMLLSEFQVEQTNQKAYLKGWLKKFDESEHEAVLADVLKTSGHVVSKILEAFESEVE